MWNDGSSCSSGSARAQRGSRWRGRLSGTEGFASCGAMAWWRFVLRLRLLDQGLLELSSERCWVTQSNLPVGTAGIGDSPGCSTPSVTCRHGSSVCWGHPCPSPRLRCSGSAPSVLPGYFYALALGQIPLFAHLGFSFRAEGACCLLTPKVTRSLEKGDGLRVARDALGRLPLRRFPESRELPFIVKYAATCHFSRF